jgi:hypothetical protein
MAFMAALPAIAQGAMQVGTIASGVIAANDAINVTKDTIDRLNNTSTQDTRSGGELSASQGHTVPPIFF